MNTPIFRGNYHRISELVAVTGGIADGAGDFGDDGEFEEVFVICQKAERRACALLST